MRRLNNYIFLMLRFLLWPVPHALKKRLLLDLNLERILKKTFPPSTPFRFIQVGGLDGKSFDSLYDFVKVHDSAGIVLEPMYDYYLQLKENYAYNKKIIPVNKAVHPSQKKVVLYRVRPEQKHTLPDWAIGIASLDKEHHLKSGIDSACITTEICEAEHLMAIVKSVVLEQPIHLFQCDVEGFDLETLKMIDFTVLRPLIIKFEYMNLSKQDTKKAIRLLKAHNYFCFYQFPDVIALQLSCVVL